MQSQHKTKYGHAIKRAWQRYGAALHKTDINKLETQICNGKAIWVWDHPNPFVPRQAYKVKYQKKQMLCVFDFRNEVIVTFLPLSGVFDYE